jgi:hypothetical protein
MHWGICVKYSADESKKTDLMSEPMGITGVYRLTFLLAFVLLMPGEK